MEPLQGEIERRNVIIVSPAGWTIILLGSSCILRRCVGKRRLLAERFYNIAKPLKFKTLPTSWPAILDMSAALRYRMIPVPAEPYKVSCVLLNKGKDVPTYLRAASWRHNKELGKPIAPGQSRTCRPIRIRKVLRYRTWIPTNSAHRCGTNRSVSRLTLQNWTSRRRWLVYNGACDSLTGPVVQSLHMNIRYLTPRYAIPSSIRDGPSLRKDSDTKFMFQEAPTREGEGGARRIYTGCEPTEATDNCREQFRTALCSREFVSKVSWGRT